MADTLSKRSRKAPEPETPVANVKATVHDQILDLVRGKLKETTNRTQIAEELGISRRNLYRYLAELGLAKPATARRKPGKAKGR